MAKTKIQVMVDQSVYQTIVEFSKVTNQSISAVVADYLVMAQPTIDRMTESLRGISALTEKQKQSFVSGLQEAEVIAKDQVQEALLLLNATLLNHDSRQMELAELSASTKGRLHPSPPSTNRGDSSPLEKQPKPKHSKPLKPISKIKKIQKIEG